MNFGKIIKDWWLYALIAGAVSWGISFLFSGILKSVPTITFAVQDINVRNEIANGINPQIGQELLQFFAGYIPAGIAGFLYVAVTAFVLIIAGRILYGFFPLGKKDSVNKLVQTFAWAGILFSVISIFLFHIPYSLVFIAAVIYFVLLALIMYAISKIGVLEVPD